MNHNISYYFTPKGASDFLVYLGWGSALVLQLQGLFMKIPFLADLSNAIVPMVYIIVGLFALPYYIKYLKLIDIVFYLALCFICALQFTIFPENSIPFEEYVYRFIFGCVPMFFIGLGVDIKKYEKPFSIVSLLCIIWAIFYIFSYMRQKTSYDEIVKEYMYHAYMYLPHVLFFIYLTFKKYSLFRLVIAVVGLFFILSLGARGPVVCILFFLVGMVFFYKKFKHPVIVWFVIGLTVLLFYIYLDKILMLFVPLLEQVGMSGRVLEWLVTDDYTANSNAERLSYIPVIMQHVKMGSPFGYGMCGSWQFIGTYPHNLMLDLWISFGWLGGSIIMITIVVIMIRSFLACSCLEEKAFLIMLIIRGFVMLFMSHNYLENEYLYFLLGYCFYLLRKKRANVSYSVKSNNSVSFVR